MSLLIILNFVRNETNPLGIGRDISWDGVEPRHVSGVKFAIKVSNQYWNQDCKESEACQTWGKQLIIENF